MLLSGCFDKARESITAQISDELGKVAKAGSENDELEDARRKRVEEILADLDFSEWDSLAEGVENHLVIVAKDGAREGLLQVNTPAEGDALDQANEQAITYAQDRAAEMVGKKWVEGELVDNPDAQWVITDATREFLRSDVEAALADGWSNDKLADALAENYAFSDTRAEVIARTETAKADVQGNLAAYKASGVVKRKQWLAAPDCCDICQELDNETVDLDADFPNGGGDGAPLHPQCRCDTLPVIEDNPQGNDDET